MQSADVAVVTEDYARAAEVARRMPWDAALPLAARSRHLADVADRAGTAPGTSGEGHASRGGRGGS